MCALHGYKPDKKTRLQQQLTEAGYSQKAIQLITDFYWRHKSVTTKTFCDICTKQDTGLLDFFELDIKDTFGSIQRIFHCCADCYRTKLFPLLGGNLK